MCSKSNNALIIVIIFFQTKLSRRYRIKSGVPTLVLLDKEGGTISASAQDRLLEDPNGISFPWRPRPVDQVFLVFF